MRISWFFPHTPPPPVWVSISEYCWQQLLLRCFPSGDFLFLSPSVFIDQNYSPSLFIYSVFYLCQSVFMGNYSVVYNPVLSLFCCPSYSSFGFLTFWQVPIVFFVFFFFWVPPYFLEFQDFPGSFWISSASALE